jgi:GTP diphosphokinase / guanosine-3',5'-bis(diphosphate) 3'-diphosphatase
MDVARVSAGLPHDVVEDTLASADDVCKLFGEDVANLVDGVAEISSPGKSPKKRRRPRTCAR